MQSMSKESIYEYAGFQSEENDHSARNILKTMMISRESDVRESILFRQGRGQFCLPSAGHEALVAIAPHIKSGDSVYCYYRDRALLLAMGVPLEDIAMGFFAKANSSSAGRQMSSHFSYKPLNVMSCATPTGLQCLPAAGTAWANKMNQSNDVVLCCIGDASTRQGEFFEALAFSLQESLPIIFVVSDNGYGISTPTQDINPLALGLLPADKTHVVNGRDVNSVYENFSDIFSQVRSGGGPRIAWVKMDRMMSHTSSDDQSRYRDECELRDMALHDPISSLKTSLIKYNVISNDDVKLLEAEISGEVKLTYRDAEQAADPEIKNVKDNLWSDRNGQNSPRFENKFAGDEWNMIQAFNSTLAEIMQARNDVVVFGEDVEDPKGGVFGLTKGLSSRYGGRVINSPLAEATIVGVASGLCQKGYFPIFELQFIDFVGTAFNQIANQIATLRWRTNGDYKCPMIIYAPCGGYISGGGPWHSQTNESWFAHIPGLKVYMPSDANDVAEMLHLATYGDDPVLFLLPKNLFQKKFPVRHEVQLYIEGPVLKMEGQHVTIVTWGNCVDIVHDATKLVSEMGVFAEIFDVRSIVPCDLSLVKKSVSKTGRLVVVQEDNKTCSFGQNIIGEILSDPEIFSEMYYAPVLVSRDDVLIPFNRAQELSVLPNVDSVVAAIKKVMGVA